MKSKYSSIVLFGLISLLPISFLSHNNSISESFLHTLHSAENIASLFVRQVYLNQDHDGTGVDCSVKSITFYKETDLNTGASSYFTKVMVTCSRDMKRAVDLRLGLEDGTQIDTSWIANNSSMVQMDSSEGVVSTQEFEFKTGSAPEYAQVDPLNKIADDRNYSNNSLMVRRSFLPVVKWVDRLFAFFQNVLLTGGMIA